MPVTVELGLDSTAAASMVSSGSGYLSSSDPLMKVLGGGLSGAALRASCDAFADAQASGLVVVVSAHAALNPTGFAGGAHAFATRYKSRCCGDFDRLGGRACPRGVRCDFAHGGIELRVRPEPLPRSLALPIAGTNAETAEAAEDDPVAAARLHQQQLDRLTLLFPLSVAGWPSLGPPPPIVPSSSGASSGSSGSSVAPAAGGSGGAGGSPAVTRARSAAQGQGTASQSASVTGAWGTAAGSRSGAGSAAVRYSLSK